MPRTSMHGPLPPLACLMVCMCVCVCVCVCVRAGAAIAEAAAQGQAVLLPVTGGRFRVANAQQLLVRMIGTWMPQSACPHWLCMQTCVHLSHVFVKGRKVGQQTLCARVCLCVCLCVCVCVCVMAPQSPVDPSQLLPVWVVAVGTADRAFAANFTPNTPTTSPTVYRYVICAMCARVSRVEFHCARHPMCTGVLYCVSLA